MFYKELNRDEAETYIAKHPTHVILRPSTYTKMYPMILAVSYIYKGSVQHSLVYKSDANVFYSVVTDAANIPICSTYIGSEIELELSLKKLINI
jgi:hypothetical protein